MQATMIDEINPRLRLGKTRAQPLAEPTRLGFLLAPQFSLMAFAAAIEPLRAANRLSERQLFDWRLTSIDGNPVIASNGIPIAVHEALGQISKIDILVICVGLEPLQFGRNHQIHHELRRLARHGTQVGGISAGSFVLADAGLLTHRRATVHWEYEDLFRSRYPAIQLTRELYVFDRDVFTCSGGTAALDMMLHYVSDVCGAKLALAVAEQFIHTRIRGEDEDQRSEIQTRYAIGSPRLVQVIKLMEGSLENPLSLSDIAHRVGVSPRQIERLFSEKLGVPPTTFYLHRRLDRAKTLLRQTLQPVRDVAVECGFGSTAHLSHAYRKAYGMAPTQERHRAGAHSSRAQTTK
jgi:AraC family transcriptional regulator, glycine betaine-responsive activator